MLTIEKTVKNGKAVFRLEGRLDTVTAPELEKELNDSCDEMNELVLDLDELVYISSAGLRVLLKAQRNVSAPGEMKVKNVNSSIMEVFDVTGFTDILTIE